MMVSVLDVQDLVNYALTINDPNQVTEQDLSDIVNMPLLDMYEEGIPIEELSLKEYRNNVVGVLENEVLKFSPYTYVEEQIVEEEPSTPRNYEQFILGKADEIYQIRRNQIIQAKKKWFEKQYSTPKTEFKDFKEEIRYNIRKACKEVLTEYPELRVPELNIFDAKIGPRSFSEVTPRTYKTRRLSSKTMSLLDAGEIGDIDGSCVDGKSVSTIYFEINYEAARGGKCMLNLTFRKNSEISPDKVNKAGQKIIEKISPSLEYNLTKILQ